MMFAKRLRDGVRDGNITCTVRIWQSPRVKVGGRYPIEGGHVVIDSIREGTLADVTDDLAQRSGFDDVTDLLDIATWPIAEKGASITVAQEVRRGEDVLVKAEVRVACISEGRAQPIPHALRVLMKADVV